MILEGLRAKALGETGGWCGEGSAETTEDSEKEQETDIV